MEEAKNESVIIKKVEQPNSYEFGKAGSRFKLYFDEPNDLKAKMDELRELKLLDDVEVEVPEGL